MQFNDLLQKQRGKRQGIQKTPLYMDANGVAYWSDDDVRPFEQPNRFKVTFGGRTVTVERSEGDSTYYMEDNEVQLQSIPRAFIGLEQDGKVLNPTYIQVKYEEGYSSEAILWYGNNQEDYKVELKVDGFEDMVHQVQTYLESKCVYAPLNLVLHGTELTFDNMDDSIECSSGYDGVMEDGNRMIVTVSYGEAIVTIKEGSYSGDILKEGYATLDPNDIMASINNAYDDLESYE